MDITDIEKIRRELRAVGVGTIGLRVPEVKELTKLLHPDEHIGGVVYGRYTGGLAWLIATDRRVIFMDKKPLFTTTDELTYDVVSGVKSLHAGLFFTVILHTRISDYTIRLVNARCSRIFVKYIESRRLESGTGDTYNLETGHPLHQFEPAISENGNEDSLIFLKNHGLAVLSTIDREGNVHGAAVYYVVNQNNLIYILTKSETGKGHNIYSHSQVALTVFEEETQQTVQLQGLAEVESNQQTKDTVFSEIIKPRVYKNDLKSPPVAKLHKGSFMIIRITPTFMSFHDYTKVD